MMSNVEYRNCTKENEILAGRYSNEITNMYTEILNSMAQSVRNRLNFTAQYIKDIVELAL